MKKYLEFILEQNKIINVDYKIILKDLKDNPITLITDFKIVKTENGKSEIKAKGYQKDKSGWKSFDDDKENKTRNVWHKYFQNGSKKIKLITEKVDERVFYPAKKIEYFIDWFYSKYHVEIQNQGWDVFHSDTDVPKNKYISDKGFFWQVQHLEDEDTLKDDQEADVLAKKLGLMLDEFGVVIGWKGVSFLEHPEELDLYKNINKFNV